MFRRMFVIFGLPAMILASIMLTQTAQAASYHFVGAQTCTSSSSGKTTTVTCTFSVAGLGNATTATAEIQAPFVCAKTTNGQQYVQPGGLASSGNQPFQVRNGRIDVSGLQLTASCPDQFHPLFTGPVSVFVNNTLVGTIPIT